MSQDNKNKKFPTSFTLIGPDKAILFSLINPKKISGNAHSIFEHYKTTTTIKEAESRGFRPDDLNYETGTNGKGFKRWGVLTFIEGYNIKANKEKLLYIIKQNRELVKDLPKAIHSKIVANLDHFEKLAKAV